MPLTREDRIAIQQTRLAAKLAAPSPYPTSRDMLTRKSAIVRRMCFENLNFVARVRADLLAGGIPEGDALALKSRLRGALQMARRNGDSAKHLGCAIHRI